MAKGLGTTLTKIPTSSITDSTITLANLVTSGSASASTFLKGDLSWATAGASGKINVVASDPSSNTAGDIWYADGMFKFTSDLTSIFGVWVVGGNLSVSGGLQYTANGTGNLDAGLLCSGWGTGVGYSAATNEYDGFSSTWTAVTACPQAHISGGGFGTQTAAVCFSGYQTNVSIGATSHEWNGSTWATGGNYLDSRQANKGAGSLSSGLGTGGAPAPSTTVNKYDGTSWSASTNLNWGTDAHGCAGNSNSSVMVMGGNGDLNGSQSFDGSSWTTLSDMIRDSGAEPGAAGSGANSAMTFGGNPIANTNSIEWDGTSWLTSGQYTTGRYGAYGAGSSTTSVLMSGGWLSGATLTSTEEYRKQVMKFIGT